LAKTLYDFIKTNHKYEMLSEKGTEKYKELFTELYKVCQEKVRELAEVPDLNPHEVDGKRKKTFEDICDRFEEMETSGAYLGKKMKVPEHVVRENDELAIAMNSAAKSFCQMYGLTEK